MVFSVGAAVGVLKGIILGLGWAKVQFLRRVTFCVLNSTMLVLHCVCKISLCV